MNNQRVFDELKNLNSTIKRKGAHRPLFIIISMIIIVAFVLLVIDTDRFLTPFVLMFFFAFMMLIIALFLWALSASKVVKQKVYNTIQIAYKSFIEQYNNTHQQDFLIDVTSDRIDKLDWVLVPSYAAKEIDYVIKDDTDLFTMFHGSFFNVFGEKQRRTYYLRGLYIFVDDIHGEDMKYQSKQPIYQGIIHTLKDVVQENSYDNSRFAFKKDYLGGAFFAAHEQDIPERFKALINAIESIDFISFYAIAMHQGQLQIALQEKTNRLPYIKKYQDEELAAIERVVQENLSLLQTLQRIIETDY